MASRANRWKRITRSLLILANLPLAGRFFGLILRKLLNNGYFSPHPSLYTRRLIDNAQPRNPITALDEQLPEIEVLFVAAKKDFGLLALAMNSAIANCANPVSKVTAIVPDADVEDFPDTGHQVHVLSESKVLPETVQTAVNNHHPEGRYGWILQQALTFWFVRESMSAGVLVIDADTFLTAKRTFLDKAGHQLLMFSEEYHDAYEEHALRMWGPRLRHHGLSYVTHHQLMQPRIVREMLETDERLRNWVLYADVALNSPISEYHSYGRWLADHHPNSVRLGRWGNRAWTFEAADEHHLSEKLRLWKNLHPEALSVSAHSYLRRGQI